MKKNVPSYLNLEERGGTWRLNEASLRFHLSHSTGETHMNVFQDISTKSLPSVNLRNPTKNFYLPLPHNGAGLLTSTSSPQKVPVDAS